MSHKKLRPFIVKVSVLGYFPLFTEIRDGVGNRKFPLRHWSFDMRYIIYFGKETLLQDLNLQL